ncbi:MAG: helix-turn-helix transcriptional regulator [Bacteroidota bacterium]
MELQFEDLQKKFTQVKSTSDLPDLIGRRFGFSAPKIPGFYHVHHIEGFAVKYMDPEACKEFNAPLETIVGLGDQFQLLVTHPEDLPRIKGLHKELVESQDESRILTYFQRIRLRTEIEDGFTLMVTSVRLNLADQTLVCITNTTDQLPVLTAKICNALNRKFETQQYVKRYMKLTRREREVFQELISGKTAKEIADKIILSVRTLEQHKKNIYKKLEINSLAQLISMARALDVTVG